MEMFGCTVRPSQALLSRVALELELSRAGCAGIATVLSLSLEPPPVPPTMGRVSGILTVAGTFLSQTRGLCHEPLVPLMTGRFPKVFNVIGTCLQAGRRAVLKPRCALDDRMRP